MDPSLTGFYRIGQKLSDVIPVLRITPRATEPSTVSVFLSVVKCGRVCRAQTCAHSGIEPSGLAKGFPQGWQTVRKNYNFWPLRKRTSPCNRYEKSSIRKNALSIPIQLSHVYGPIADGVLQGGPKMSSANGGFVSVLLTPLFYCMFFVCSFFVTISRQPAGRFKPNFACRRTVVPDVSSPLLRVSGPRGAEKGRYEIFVTIEVNGEFLHFGVLERYLSNAWTDPHQI